MIFTTAILFFLLHLIPSCNIRGNYQRLDFSFENNYWSDNSWITRTKGGVFRRDSISFVDGKQSWFLTKEPNSFDFNSYVFQYFNLPVEAKKIELSIYSKSDILDYAYLKLYCLDKDENIVLRDSTLISKRKDWIRHSLTVFPQNAERLYIEIQAKSKDTILTDQNIKQKLWIDHVQLKINECEINSFSLPSYQFSKDDIEKINDHTKIELEKLEELNSISDLKNHRILAFGESVHGSAEIQHFTCEIIKNMIINNSCSLVLLELPFEMGLRINDYINGNSAEDIKQMLMLFNYNTTELDSLFTWIKNRNTYSSTKVNISGIDINHQFLLENHLLTFLKNQKINNDGLNSIIESIGRNKYKDALDLLQNDRSIISDLGYYKHTSILYAIKNRIDFPRTVSYEREDRDYCQFMNAKFSINLFRKDSEKIIIYAHLGHVNKKNSQVNRQSVHNLGYFMNKEYRSNYFVTALLVGKGTISNTDSLCYNSGVKLQNPENGSIEDLCMEANAEVFYKSSIDLNTTYSTRSIGFNYVKNQFYSQNHIGRYDALVFFKNSHGFQIPKSYPRTKEEILKYILEEKKKNSR